MNSAASISMNGSKGAVIEACQDCHPGPVVSLDFSEQSIAVCVKEIQGGSISLVCMTVV